MLRSPSLARALAFVVVTFAVGAYGALTRTGTPSVAFNASGPAGMTIRGTTNELDVVDQGAKILIRVPLRNLTTGISLRDDHMRNKYLEVNTYPNAELTVDRATIQFPSGNASTSGDAQGSMALHGHTQNVSFHYTVTGSSGGYQVTGSISQLNMQNFGISVPSYLGITVKPQVDVQVQFTATP